MCTLSSYVLSLLAINYLQCGVSPPVIPSLQQTYPKIFRASNVDIFTLPYLSSLPPYLSANHDSLGEILCMELNINRLELHIKVLPTVVDIQYVLNAGTLLTGFFDHFCRLDFTNDVPSVRLGRLLTNASCETFSRRHGTAPRQWTAYVCVEEPFDRSNAARSVVQRYAFDRILQAAHDAKRALQNPNASLRDILL